MPQTGPQVVTITLTTEIHGGHECTRRSPPKINGHRGDIDVVRILNGNPQNGSSITVKTDQATAGNIFHPVPALQSELDPGEFVDWSVRAVIHGSQSEGFTTDPPSCAGQDSGDITIQC